MLKQSRINDKEKKMLIKEPIIKEPINIEGQTVMSKSNETFVVEKQDNEIITLSNGKRYLYSRMFSSGSFVLTDKELQEKVMENIKILAEVAPPPNPLWNSEKAEEYRKKIENLKQKRLLAKNISYEEGDLTLCSGFEYMKTYGKKALSIYENACRYLAFNPQKKVSFNPMQILYAESCTPDGYSVWMLPHSNLNNECNGIWANFFDTECGILQFDLKNWHYIIGEKRLAFMKQKDKNYVFMGIYQLTEVKKDYPDKGITLEVYSLISKDYPEHD